MKVSAAVLRVASQSESRLRINSATMTAMPRPANQAILLVICAPFGQASSKSVSASSQAAQKLPLRGSGALRLFNPLELLAGGSS